MKVDVWVDVVCPFCAMGVQRLREAVEQVEGDVEVRLRSYQLQPDMSLDERVSLSDVLRPLHQISHAEVVSLVGDITAKLNDMGLDGFRMLDADLANTTLAHQLLQFAQSEGLGGPMWDALRDHYFRQLGSLYDAPSLSSLAERVGLDASETLAVLQRQQWREAVEADHAEGRALGCTSVPFFVVDGVPQGVGSGSTERLVEMLRQPLREASPVAG